MKFANIQHQINMYLLAEASRTTEEARRLKKVIDDYRVELETDHKEYQALIIKQRTHAIQPLFESASQNKRLKELRMKYPDFELSNEKFISISAKLVEYSSDMQERIKKYRGFEDENLTRKQRKIEEIIAEDRVNEEFHVGKEGESFGEEGKLSRSQQFNAVQDLQQRSRRPKLTAQDREGEVEQTIHFPAGFYKKAKTITRMVPKYTEEPLEFYSGVFKAKKIKMHEKLGEAHKKKQADIQYQEKSIQKIAGQSIKTQYERAPKGVWSRMFYYFAYPERKAQIAFLDSTRTKIKNDKTLLPETKAELIYSVDKLVYLCLLDEHDTVRRPGSPKSRLETVLEREMEGLQLENNTFFRKLEKIDKKDKISDVVSELKHWLERDKKGNKNALEFFESALKTAEDYQRVQKGEYKP